MKEIILAIATLSGTIIGVGIFSLPYLTLLSGFWTILGYFLVLGIVSILIHLFFGELALKTEDYKRFPGFAKIYLGKWGEKIAIFSTTFGLSGAILAYLIVGGGFLNALLSPIFGGSELIYTLFYFLIGAILIFFGIKIVSKIELLGLLFFFLSLFLIFIKGWHLIKIENLLITKTPSLKTFFLPYGPILFSLWGAALIPEVEEMLKGKKQLLLKIIPISILISALIYLFFIFLILGICGNKTTESALSGLKTFLGDGIVSLTLFFGILTTFTSFISLGLTLKKVFWYDLGFNKNFAFFLTCFIPLFLYLIGIKEFISVISFVGSILLGIDGILILAMYKKIKPGQILIYPLFLVLICGIIFEILHFLKCI
jgi:tyrosine-specific transport protein